MKSFRVMLILATAIFIGGCGKKPPDTPARQPAADIEKLREENRKLKEQVEKLDMFCVNALLERAKQAELRRENPYYVPRALLRLSSEEKARLNLQLLDFAKPAPFDAAKMAAADIRAGHLNIFTGGLSRFYDPPTRKRLREKYDVWIMFIADCTDGAAIFKVMDAYNPPVEKAIEKKFGKSLSDLWSEAAAEVEKEKPSEEK